MTPQSQQEYIITDAQLCSIEHDDYPMLICNQVRARPHTSIPQNDYRDLFVSDLISIVKWDAEHGNPELFKAVNSLKQHYKTFAVEQHDIAIRNATLDKLYDKANQRQIDVETEEGTIIEVIEKGEVLAWIDELRTQQEQP